LESLYSCIDWMSSPPVNKWLVAASVSCGSIMGVLDSTIVNVALPQIQGAVGATLQEITWIATGYTIAAVLLMPLVAFLGRRFGQKRVYLFCLGLFLLGSALCGLSRTLPQLIAFRVLQGLGGGALQPTEEAILRQTFPKSEQGMAMALTGMIMMVGPALGPVLGGYIVDHLHWSWIFFVSLPIGLLGFVMTWTFVREDPEILAKNRARATAERTNVDWSGIGLLSTCLATTEFVIEEGQRRYWFDDSLIRVFTFVAVTTFAAFIARQLTAKAPVMNLRLLKDPRFATGMLLSVFVMCTLMATMFLLSVFMQQARGFTAMQAGLATLPMMLAMFVVMPIAGAVYERFSPRLTMAGGILLLASGAYELSQVTLAMGQWDLALPLAMQGAGMALIFVPMETTAFSRIPRHLLADAAGLSNVLKGDRGRHRARAVHVGAPSARGGRARRARRARGNDEPARRPAALHAAGVHAGILSDGLAIDGARLPERDRVSRSRRARVRTTLPPPRRDDSRPPAVGVSSQSRPQCDGARRA
jgi:DHA2 family multidrug resistance protein